MPNNLPISFTAPVNSQQMKQGALFSQFPLHNPTCLQTSSFEKWWQEHGVNNTGASDSNSNQSLVAISSVPIEGSEQRVNAMRNLGQVPPILLILVYSTPSIKLSLTQLLPANCFECRPQYKSCWTYVPRVMQMHSWPSFQNFQTQMQALHWCLVDAQDHGCPYSCPWSWRTSHLCFGYQQVDYSPGLEDSAFVTPYTPF